jgi:NCS1 family nucleobase:cation symporter-1
LLRFADSECIQWICGTAPSLPGFVAEVNTNVSVPIGLTHLYYICFLSGFCISAAVYCLLHWVFPAHRLDAFVKSNQSAEELMVESREKWDQDETGVIIINEGEEKI